MCTESENRTKAPVEPRSYNEVLAGIEVRLDACRTLASLILESLPYPAECRDMACRVNEASDITVALADVIDLCREDIKRSYEQRSKGANHE
jgi:hypothetical protein